VGKSGGVSWKQGVGSLADQEEGVIIIEYMVVVVTAIADEAKWIGEQDLFEWEGLVILSVRAKVVQYRSFR